MSVEAARTALLNRFAWTDGHADVWRVFADPVAFSSVVNGLVDPWRDAGVTHVLGIESRGFLLGGAASLSLGVGFVAVRKSTGLLPGPTVTAQADADYRGYRYTLRMQPILTPLDAVLLVDDWAERGSQARAARHLVQACGARFVGISVMVDQLAAGIRADLGRVTALVRADELGSSVPPTA